MKRCFEKIKKAAVSSAAMLIGAAFLGGCAKKSAEPLKFCGGRVDLYAENYKAENTRYRFETEYEFEGGGTEGIVKDMKILITDKESGKSEYLPRDVFDDDMCNYDSLFATENYLFFIGSGNRGSSVKRVSLKDYSEKTFYKDDFSGPEKVVFGLTFDYKYGIGLSNPDYVFSDEKNVYIASDIYGVYKAANDGSFVHIIEDNVSGGLIYDIDNIYYLTEGNVLYRYKIKSGKTAMIAENVGRRSLRLKDGKIVYEAENGEEMTL